MVPVGREDEARFVGLFEARGNPVFRIGVTDNSGEIGLQDFATWQINNPRGAHRRTLP